MAPHYIALSLHLKPRAAEKMLLALRRAGACEHTVILLGGDGLSGRVPPLALTQYLLQVGVPPQETTACTKVMAGGATMVLAALTRAALRRAVPLFARSGAAHVAILGQRWNATPSGKPS